VRAVVVGAGLGGLLAGAFLARNGHEIIVLEKSAMIGGRFTNLPYKGFQLSTGALHMIPHGEDGPLAHLLRILGAKVEIVNSNPKGKILWEGKIFHYRESWKFLSVKEKAKALKLLAEIRMNKLPKEEIPADEWIKEKIGENEFLLSVLESFAGWADSVSLSDLTALELAKEIRAALRWGGPGLIRGGCKAVIDELERIIMENKGKILTRKEVVEINIEEKKVYTRDNEEYSFDVAISNVGVRETVKLIGRDYFDRDYLKQVDSIEPSEGIKFNLAVPGEPRIGNTIVFTPGLMINGFNEPSALDKSLAREGYTLIMAHMALKNGNVKKAIEKGWEELLEIFPEGEPLLAQVYRDGNPVNRTRAGLHIEWPLNEVLVVGDGYRPPGGIEVDGIALGVMKALEKLNLGSFSEWYL